ncbi:MAG: hypothetical protein JO033_26225 [Acidobacteriaceae bacterium]|nr:hypothetical protein [Acidobacteriaceae bacterium]MBV9499532.1 hypothetical protein [Acidobacteriaceae bacterium]
MTKRILIFLLSTAGLLTADTLVLHNGQRLDGTYAGGDSRTIRFTVGNQVNTYNLNDVDSIRFSSGQVVSSSANTGYPPYAPPPPPTYRNAAPAPAPPQAPQPTSSDGPAGIEVPAGTQIVVRLIDPVDSQEDSLGQTFRASIDQPVIVNGETLIPRGADAVAALVDSQKSGKIEGRTVLTLDLRSVTVDGRTYQITTTGVAQASSSRGQRSAKVIGGTAALGAIIGGIAGGGKGAAIGAGSGAAVGTAAEVATSGQRVKIPSETRLTFTLQNPLDL